MSYWITISLEVILIKIIPKSLIKVNNFKKWVKVSKIFSIIIIIIFKILITILKIFFVQATHSIKSSISTSTEYRTLVKSPSKIVLWPTNNKKAWTHTMHIQTAMLNTLKTLNTYSGEIRTLKIEITVSVRLKTINSFNKRTF